MSGSCPFCDIVSGDRHQEVVYEDDSVVAFLCEPPATWGHLLVVPRTHVEDLWSIGREDLQAVFAGVHLLARALRTALEPSAINVRQNSGRRAGQDVPHFHVHVVPRYDDDTVQPGCVWGAPPWEPPSGGGEERRRVADALRAAVEATGA